MKKIKITGISLSLLLLFASTINAAKTKKEYEIKVKINGLKNATCLLGNYFADGKQYIQDSAKADAKGSFVFTGDEKLLGGVYLIVLPNKKYFEIMIPSDKEQFFSLETDSADFVKNMKVTGSNENQLFYSYLQFISQKQKEDETLRKQLKESKTKNDSSQIQVKLDAIREAVKNQKNNFVKDHPSTFVTKIFKASEDIVPPPAPKLENGRVDSTFAFRYYKAHFWDNIDLSDARMLRTPILNNKIKYYLDNLTAQTPDSLNVSCDYLIEKARGNKDVFKYMVYYTTYTYETSKLMSMDAVFVHLVEKYYMTNQAFWMDSTQLKKIAERATILKPLLIGKKTWNLTLEDTNGVFRPLYDVKAKYTIMFFWDPDCGHCQKALPKLVEIYDKYHSMGVEVYAACTESEASKWKKMIKEKNLKWINVADPNLHNNFRHDYDITTTPQIYLLDDNKIIKAKKIDVEQLGDILEKILVEKRNILN